MSDLVYINVSELSSEYNFEVTGVSYVGAPKDNTVMYISKKINEVIRNLDGRKHCLVFAEEGVEVPENLKKKNCFVFTQNPQREYARFITKFGELKKARDRSRKYTYNEATGVWMGENVSLGKNVYIEPMCFIGHGVVIGDDSVISAGSIIRNAYIGRNFHCYEKALIGIDSFNLAKDEEGNTFRIPSLGNIEIGNYVDVGANSIIALAATSVTKIHDFVKIDANVVIGHDSIIGKNVEIATNANLGGYVNIGDNTFIAMNSTIKNRVTIGINSFVGIGSVVIKDVPDSESVFGVPARKMKI